MAGRIFAENGGGALSIVGSKKAEVNVQLPRTACIVWRASAIEVHSSTIACRAMHSVLYHRRFRSGDLKVLVLPLIYKSLAIIETKFGVS